MKTMDEIESAPDGAIRAPASNRNAAPILEILRAHMPAKGRVLEIASGSGEHALAFSSALPGLDWTPSDPSPQARASISAWKVAKGPANLNAPLALDAEDPATWPAGAYDALVCINMIHISPWRAAEGLMRLAGERLQSGGLLYLYGAYREDGVELAASNAAFDDSLKARNPEWGLRRVSEVSKLASENGLRLTLKASMPANNLSLLFRKF